METAATPIWQTHKQILTEQGVDFDQIIELRKHLHKHAEGGFKEFDTQRKIRETLLAFGLDADSIKDWAGTGLVADIVGTGPQSDDGDCNWVAFRADIDALEMKENTGVDYTTVTSFAHMWGHDGHMATLLATAQFWIKHRDKIPQNKTIRLLFQPAEEGLAGATVMIKDGWMEKVDEVYGYHNAPFGIEGSISTWVGPLMAGAVHIEIEIKGRGGHGSEPAKSIDPITAAAYLLTAFHTIKSRNVLNTDVVAFTIWKIVSGTRDNVIPDDAFLYGTVRYFEEEVKSKVIQKITDLTTSIWEGFEWEGKVILRSGYPVVINSEKQTNLVLGIAKYELGQENVNTKNSIPWFASEDFSYRVIIYIYIVS